MQGCIAVHHPLQSTVRRRNNSNAVKMLRMCFSNCKTQRGRFSNRLNKGTCPTHCGHRVMIWYLPRHMLHILFQEYFRGRESTQALHCACLVPNPQQPLKVVGRHLGNNIGDQLSQGSANKVTPCGKHVMLEGYDIPQL